jgi:hypothetical protein
VTQKALAFQVLRLPQPSTHKTIYQRPCNSAVFAVPLVVDYDKETSNTPCISTHTLQHIQMEAPFFSHNLWLCVSDCLHFQSEKSRPQGLATLSTMFSPYPSTLGFVFQKPTLMGFALQSFTPPAQSTSCFHEGFRSRAFPQNP